MSNIIAKQFNVTLDVSKVKASSNNEIVVFQGDSVILNINVLENEINKDLTGCQYILVEQYDKDIPNSQNTEITYENNIIKIKLKDGMMGKVGCHIYQLIISDLDETIKTNTFRISVAEALDSEIMNEATDEINTLQELQKEIENNRRIVEEYGNFSIKTPLLVNRLSGSAIIYFDSQVFKMASEMTNKAYYLAIKGRTKTNIMQSCIATLSFYENEGKIYPSIITCNDISVNSSLRIDPKVVFTNGATFVNSSDTNVKFMIKTNLAQNLNLDSEIKCVITEIG